MVTILKYSRVLMSCRGDDPVERLGNYSVQNPVELGEGDGNHQLGDKRFGERRPRLRETRCARSKMPHSIEHDSASPANVARCE